MGREKVRRKKNKKYMFEKINEVKSIILTREKNNKCGNWTDPN